MTVKQYKDTRHGMEYNLCDGCKALFFQGEMELVSDAPTDVDCDICMTSDNDQEEQHER